MTVVRLVGLAHGEPSPADGLWLVDYDPRGDGFYIDGERQRERCFCMLHVTRDHAKAKQFENAGDAFEFWRMPSGKTRPDGKPDRPLTAYTVDIQ